MPDTETTGKAVTDTPNQEITDNVVTNAVKQKKRNGLDMMWNGDTEPGDNARYIRYAMASWDMPPIDIADPEQVKKRITEYFKFCDDNDRKPNLVGVANWLGVDRSTLNSWKRGEYRTETHSPIIRKVIDILEEIWADYMQNGKINPASGIFLGKNFFGYKDVQDVVVTPNNPYPQQNSADIDRIIEALPEPDEQ